MTTSDAFTGTEATAWARLVAVSELLPTALDGQLQRDAEITHFEYLVLMTLAESPEQTSRLTRVASQTNATLPRLSHVARRLDERGLLHRFPCPEDRRATNATITPDGLALLESARPGHVRTVRDNVLDALTVAEIEHLSAITAKVLSRLDPEQRMAATCTSNTEVATSSD